MTEEINKGCEFKQNYNIFGLDDKPCCYLYHKYCDDINGCDYKQRIHLEQENKSLQAYKDINEDFKKAWDELNEKHKRYRSALEEIKRIIVINKDEFDHCLYHNYDEQILNIINEVLNDGRE